MITNYPDGHKIFKHLCCIKFDGGFINTANVFIENADSLSKDSTCSKCTYKDTCIWLLSW